MKDTPDIAFIQSKFPDARQESDGSISFSCPVCEAEGHPNKPITLFINGALACARFASAGTEANRAHCVPIYEQLGSKLGSTANNSALVVRRLFNDTLTLELVTQSRSKAEIVARNCNSILSREILDLRKSSERAAFVQSLTGFDEAQQSAIHQVLLEMPDAAKSVEAAIDDENEKGDSQATMLIKMADVQLIHDADLNCFAVMKVGNHKETWLLKSKGFKRWLARLFFEKMGKAAGSQAIQDALAVLEGKAIHEGPERKIFVRLGESDGKIYLDLADDEWRAVEIDEFGWRVVSIPPVEFQRAKGMLPLPEPQSGGTLADLRACLNLEGDENKQHWVLLASWLIAALRLGAPFPILALHGEQGSGKSTASRMLRALIDPNSCPLRSAPRDERDLMIAATNSLVCAFDNLTHLNESLSNALCRLSTGGGFSTRELFSDGDEKLFDAMRPLMLNGINEVATRSDLIDRSILINLPTIPEEKRRDEKDDVWPDFEKKRARILGALLDCVSAALKNIKNVKLTSKPRMADFAKWATAAETKAGFKEGDFIKAYTENRSNANALAVNSSIVAPLIVELLEGQDSWEGLVAGLLKALNSLLEANHEDPKRKPGWPQSPEKLSKMVKEVIPNLRKLAIEVSFGERTSKGRKVTLRKSGNKPTQPTQPSKSQSDNDLESDGCNDGTVTVPFNRHTDTASGDGAIATDIEPSHNRHSVNDCEQKESDGSDGSDGLNLPYSKSLVAIDVETEAFDAKRGITPRNCQMIGLSFSYDGEQAEYITDKEAWQWMMPETDQTVAIYHNAKFDRPVLARTGLPLHEQFEDTLIAAHLLCETGSHGLKDLAKQHLGVEDPVTFKEVERMRLLDPEAFNEYARNDSRFTHRLWQKFAPELDRQGLTGVYQLEKAVLPVVLAMEARGMLIDVAALQTAAVETQAHLARLKAEIYDHAGCKFKLRSPQALAAILKDKLGLPLPTGGKKGAPVVDKYALKDLAGQHPIIPVLLEFKEVDKLASAFIGKLPGLADAEGRIHPTFNQLGATSGRFTCSEPNIQQMPRSSGLAALLRAAFIAGPGRKLVCADWSQIELRVLAHFSADTALMEAFLQGADLHTQTATRMFGKTESDISKKERTIAKSINFGLAYGMGAPGLFKSLHAVGLEVTEDECRDFIATYNRSYPGVRRFLDAVGRQAEQDGFITTLSGRRRRLNDDGSNMLSVKNAIIQGSAADIAKAAMVRIHRALPQDAYLIAMVHDEMIVDCREEQAEEVLGIVREIMERQPRGFTVPMLVEAKIGQTWGECK